MPGNQRSCNPMSIVAMALLSSVSNACSVTLRRLHLANQATPKQHPPSAVPPTQKRRVGQNMTVDQVELTDTVSPPKVVVTSP